jgi:transposase
MNQLKVSTQQSIIALVARGWSQRRISRELELDRETVARYVKLAAANPATIPALGSADSKPASNLALGSEVDAGPPPKPATNPALGSEGGHDSKPASNPAIGIRCGPPSLCAPFALQIETALQVGLSAQRIYQDLVREHGFKGAYGSVKRFVRTLAGTTELPFRRMECAPGDELQIDFGCGAWIKEDGRRRRRPHLFRAVLSHSRKAYSEVVWRQNTETVIRCLENAFRHFNGVTATLVPDSRAVVSRRT